MTSIWSLRSSVARGIHWVKERDCTVEEVADWLAVFRKDEPGIAFIEQKNKPSSATIDYIERYL